MRATVEIDDEQWAAIKSIAARRGQKGYGPVLREALTFYLAHQDEADYDERLRSLTSVAGSISEAQAARMLETINDLRENWR